MQESLKAGFPPRPPRHFSGSYCPLRGRRSASAVLDWFSCSPLRARLVFALAASRSPLRARRPPACHSRSARDESRYFSMLKISVHRSRAETEVHMWALRCPPAATGVGDGKARRLSCCRWVAVAGGSEKAGRLGLSGGGGTSGTRRRRASGGARGGGSAFDTRTNHFMWEGPKGPCAPRMKALSAAGRPEAEDTRALSGGRRGRTSSYPVSP